MADSGKWRDILGEKPARRGAAKIFVVAQRVAIIEAIKQGYSLKAIHSSMIESEETSIGYASFVRAVNSAGLVRRKAKKGEIVEDEGEKTFKHNSRPNVEDLF